MGNNLFKEIESFKTTTNNVFWGINPLMIYFLESCTLKDDLNKAERFYRNCVTSDHFKRKLKINGLLNLNHLINECSKNKDEFNELEKKKNKLAEKYLLRFITMINIILFQRNQKNNNDINHLSLLLLKCGLSYNGIHVLHSLGLASSPKTFSKKLLGYKNEQIITSNYTQIHWYDNIYRTLQGYNKGASICYTAHGITEIIDSEPICINNQMITIPSIKILFNNEFINYTNNIIKNKSDIDNYPLLNSLSHLYLPLRAPINYRTSGKIQFKAKSLLNFSPGCPYGTIKILKDLLNTPNGLNSLKYSFLTVDYDIYWRLIRMFHSSSFIKPSFTKCKMKLILILGPWHILYNLFAKIWKFYLPYLFSFMYFTWRNTKATVDAPFIDQLHVFIALYKYRRSILHSIQRNAYKLSPLCLSFKWLIEYLIPTVLFYFILL